MMDLLLDEERATRLLEYTTRISCQYVRLMAEAGADMVSNGDSPAGPQYDISCDVCPVCIPL